VQKRIPLYKWMVELNFAIFRSVNFPYHCCKIPANGVKCFQRTLKEEEQ
jgi:hypothetical protein